MRWHSVSSRWGSFGSGARWNAARRRPWQVASLAAVLGLVASQSSATPVDAARVLGCEDAVDWYSPSGATLSTGTSRTQGDKSLAIATNGYTTVQTRLMGPLGSVADHISVDLRVPSTQPNPSWTGAVQAYVSSPSLGVYERYLGQIDLGGLPRGAFSQLAFALPSDLRTQLSGSYSDLTVKFALNVPAGVVDPYLLDNVQVSPTLPGITTTGPNDLSRVLGFELNAGWTISGGTLSTWFTPRSQGNTSLRVAPNGYTVVSSPPMTTLAPVADKVAFDLWVPSTQPNAYWWGAVQLYVTAPSLGLYNSYIGQKNLLGLSTNKFNKLEFPITTQLQAQLNSAGYSDLSFSIALNLPSGASPHYLDNFNVGQVTIPSAPVSSQPRPDFVGIAHTGAAAVAIDNQQVNVPVTFANFEIKAIDEGCVPGASTVCRYSLTTMHLWFGAFSVAGLNASKLKATNNRTIEFALGGTHPASFLLPPSAEFVAWIHSDQRYVATLQPAGVLFTFNPAGAGSVAITGIFTGNVAGHATAIGLSATADSPLTNRPPVANAGADAVLSKASGSCQLDVALNGNLSTDPDNNLAYYRWTAAGYSVGSGVQPTVPFRKSGVYPVELKVTDEFRSVARDTMSLTVNLPPGCPSL